MTSVRYYLYSMCLLLCFWFAEAAHAARHETTVQADSNSGISMIGATDITFYPSNGTVEIKIDEISNGRIGGVSGSLRLELWAFSAPYPDTQVGYSLATSDTIGQLSGGAYWTNVTSGSMTFAPPPSGKWHLSVLLEELTSAGWTAIDYRNMSQVYSSACNCLVIGSAGDVIEFYNSYLDHYFITANGNEAAAIDSGSAGLGWYRTGNIFKSGGDTYVCRFYGSQSPGPNSHFYTVDTSECNNIRQLQATTPSWKPRWNFESLDFVSSPPINGQCLNGEVPIYRAYNNGFARGIDSNHRITSDFNAIQAVLNRGWIYEGVVMCAPR